MTDKMIPTIDDNSPNKNMNTVIITAVNNAINPSRFTSSLLVVITPATTVVIPKIPAMFHMFAPIATLIPISGLPVKMAIIADPNSGSDVPTAEAVTPSIISDMPNASPISTKLSTNKSADLITIINEISNAAINANKIISIYSPEECCLLPLINLSNK